MGSTKRTSSIFATFGYVFCTLLTGCLLSGPKLAAQVSVQSTGSGSNGFVLTQGTQIAGSSTTSTIWADSTTKRLMLTNPSGGNQPLSYWPCNTLGCIAYAGPLTFTLYNETKLDGNTTTTPKYLQSVGSAGAATAPSWAQVNFTDLGGTAAATQLPNPTTTTLGGVKALAAVTHQWINSILATGVPVATVPQFSVLIGSAVASQLPAPTTTAIGAVLGINYQKALASGIAGNGSFRDVIGSIIPANTIAAGKCAEISVWYKHSGGSSMVTYQWNWAGTNTYTQALGGGGNNQNEQYARLLLCNDPSSTSSNAMLGPSSYYLGAAGPPFWQATLMDLTASSTISLQFNFVNAAGETVISHGMVVQVLP